jgi:hypothetical protein
MKQSCDSSFPLSAAQESLAKIKKAYTADNHAANFTGRFYDPYLFTLKMQKEGLGSVDDRY